MRRFDLKAVGFAAAVGLSACGGPSDGISPPDGGHYACNPAPKSWAVPSIRYREGDPTVTGIAAVQVDWGPLFEIVLDDGRVLHETFGRGVMGPIDEFHADRALRAVAIGGDVIWAVGDRGLIVRGDTTKQANYARVDPSPTERDWLSAWATAGGEPWLVGAAGTVAHFTAGEWKLEQAGNESLHGIWGLADGSRLWTVGERGTVFERRSDGLWQPDMGAQTLAGEATLRAITGAVTADASVRLWVVGEGGLAIQFGGGVWSRLDVGTTQTLNALWIDTLVDEIWGVGNQGTARVWSTLGAGHSGVRSEDPDWRGFNDAMDLLTISGIHTVRPWGRDDQIEAGGPRWCLVDRWYQQCPIP